MCSVCRCACLHVVDVCKHSVRAGAAGPNVYVASRPPLDADVASGRPHQSSPADKNALRQPFNSPLSGTARVSWYQKGKNIQDLLEQETVSDSGISGPYANLHLTQADNHARTPCT